MLIGILSDTHDRAEMMAAAIALLQENKAEFFIHCGDVGEESMLDHLAGLPSAFIWGNNDWDRASLQRYALQLGISCYGGQADLTLGGKRFAVVHGDDLRLRQRLLDSQEYDYLLQGHTHVKFDGKVGRTRIINPGALHRAKPKTVALLDTETDLLKFLTVAE
jgi:putative phosphoesterase